MVEIHEINLRSNHLSLTLHEILVLVLKYSISLHDDCKTKNDLNVGLAEVIAANNRSFNNPKGPIQKCDHHKKHFYDGDKNLKNSIDIEKLDIQVLVILLRTKFIYTPSNKSVLEPSIFLTHRCCKGCKHDKCLCGKEIDTKESCKNNKANCGYDVCLNNFCKFPEDWRCSVDCKHLPKGCTKGTNPSDSPECSESIKAGKTTRCMKMGCPCRSSAKCDFIIIRRFIDVAAFFRNCISHTTYSDWCDLENGNPALEEFPLSKTWREVWDVVNKASLDCLKVLHSVKFIKIDDYKDYEMKLRISLKEDQKYLVPIVEANEMKHELQKLTLGNFNSYLSEDVAAIIFGNCEILQDEILNLNENLPLSSIRKYF